MMKSEFVERVNAIREKRGYKPIAFEDVTPEDYQIIEFVYMYHPAFDVPDAKTAIAEVYTIMRSCVNGMAILRWMLPDAKKAEQIEARRSELRSQIAALNKEMTALNSQMSALKDGTGTANVT